MQKIIIKNFGPISNAEIEIEKIVVIIGDNATGKSSIIKLISTFLWIEKALFRGSNKKWFESENRLKNTFLPYHRIENYLKPDTVIEYFGKTYTLKYQNNRISIENNKKNNYQLPQIMYVPAERNFLSYVRNAKKDLKLSGALLDFTTEYYNAAENLQEPLKLPIANFEIEYNKRHEILYVKNKSVKIKITEAASGLQSLIPLCLVSNYLSKLIQKIAKNVEMTSEDVKQFQKEINAILNDENLSEQQRHFAISELSSKFNKKGFANIVEEPEQNLFPTSQVQLIQNLVSIGNQNENNTLIISTHSPYILGAINNLIFAHSKGQLNQQAVQDKIDNSLWLDSEKVRAYMLTKGKLESIIDQELGLIQNEKIDDVSRIINEEYDYLDAL